MNAVAKNHIIFTCIFKSHTGWCGKKNKRFITSANAISYKGDDLNQLDPSSTADCDSDEPARYERELKSSDWGTAALGSVALAFLQPESRQEDKKYYSGKNKFKLKIEQPEDYPTVCKKAGFGPGDDTPDGSAPKANEFDTKAYIKTLWEKITEWLEGNFLKTKKRKKVQIVYKESLPAAAISAEYSTKLAGNFLNEELLKELDPRDEAEALSLQAGLKAGVAFSPKEEGYHPVNYSNLGRKRNFDCFTFCSVHPEKRVKGVEVSKVKVFSEKSSCLSSCDPKNYEAPFTPIPKPPNLPPECHWNPAYGCDYYTCKVGEIMKDGTVCQRSCELDPVCESGLCTKNKLYTKPYLPDGTYCPDKQCSPGDCYWLHFDKPSSHYYDNLPAGFPQTGPPWGPFFTANPDVCTRGGGREGCNPDCCQGARSENYD